MRILSYTAHGATKDSLHYSTMNFKKLNLIVGNTGAGKTRLLNTIFNAARHAVRKEKFYVGGWDIIFEQEGKTYRWLIEIGDVTDDEPKVFSERILQLAEDEEIVIVDRTMDSFIFNGVALPKLSSRESSILILQEEESIGPLYRGFSLILRRNFSGSDLEHSTGYQTIVQSFIRKIKKTQNLDDLFSSNLNLNCKLYILFEYFRPVYDQVCSEFRAVFPFVSEFRLFDAERFGLNHPGIVPIFSLKEKGSSEWVPSHQFSSGMRKVLLILTDIFTLPDGSVYLIDEYENSLGINAINFFPGVLYETERTCQFIITSHHPYIIANVPVKNWIILHRNGTDVQAKSGEELVEHFGKSKQKAFIQLINDSFYTEGVE